MKFLSLAAVLAALVASGCSQPAEETPADGMTNAAASSAMAYPLTTCVVSGEDLGSMGDPYVLVHDGTEVKFCCKGCDKEFTKEPAKYLKMLADARK